MVITFGILLFFGLSRTEIGRESLRQELERQFVNRFEGRLHIGSLSGNFWQQFYAGDVRVFGDDGEQWLGVDSVVISPRWRSLLVRRFSLRSLHIEGPTLLVRFDSVGSLIRPLERRSATVLPVSSRSIDRVELRVVDGTVRTRHAVAALVTDAEDIFARAVLDRGRDADVLDVLELSGFLPGFPLTVEALTGQFVADGQRLVVNRLRIDTGRGGLEATGVVDNYTDREMLALDASVEAYRLNLDALRRLVPSLPVSDTLDAALTLRGSLSRIKLEQLLLIRGRTVVAADGEFIFARDSLAFHLRLRETAVTTTDLRAILPEAALPATDNTGVLRLHGLAHGSRSRRSVRASATFDLRGSAGHAAGTASIARPEHGMWIYTAFVTADSLDIGIITGRPPLSSQLHGRITLEGSGLEWDRLDATIGADLVRSTFAGRSVDGLDLDANFNGRVLQASATAWKAQQQAQLLASLDWNGSTPEFDVTLWTHEVDLGPILLSDSLHSNLNAEGSLHGFGLSLKNLEGRFAVNVDTSVVAWGTRRQSLPPHELSLRLGGAEAGALEVDVGGDFLDLELESNTRSNILGTLAAVWNNAVREALDRQREHFHPGLTLPRNVPWPPLDQLILQGEAATALDSVDLDQLRLLVSLSLRRPDIASAWFPWLLPVRTDLDASLSATADANRLTYEVAAAADSIAWGTHRISGFRTELGGMATLDGPLEHTLVAWLDFQADAWESRELALMDPRVTVKAQGGEADIGLTTEGDQGARVTATLTDLGDRLRLTIPDVSFSFGGYTWDQPERTIIDVFADALHFVNFRIGSPAQQGVLPQSIDVNGVLSSAAEDTVTIALQSVGLEQLSDFLDRERTFGGILNGRIQWTGLNRPEVYGNLEIDHMRLEDHIFGRFEARSRFEPGSPDVAIEASLKPVAGASASENRALRFVDNDVSIVGTVRLPFRQDRGQLNLAVDVTRADAFFFEYIIRGLHDSMGAIAGSGSISGTFANPIFNADLTLRDGSFHIPDYNLRYKTDANIRVTRRGIAIDRLALSDSTGGSADIRGMMHFNDYRFFSLDIEGQLDALQIMNVGTFTNTLPFYGMIWASGDATLAGPMNNAFLRSANLSTSPQSDLYIPIMESDATVDPGYIVYADSAGRIPEAMIVPRRETILNRRVEGERNFAGGLQMDLNILAPEASTLHLVIDPLLGDVINGMGSGRVQLQLREGDMATFGHFTVDSGDYLFTAGELFVRRFLINEGIIIWAGDPTNPQIDISADYRTRASRSGLPQEVGGALQTSLPLIVGLQISGELNALQIGLSLAVDQRQEAISDTPLLEAYLNQPDRAAQHATSVLLTNSFQLSAEGTTNDVLAASAFNSVSNLVASQLNRYISQVIPNADLTLGVQSDEAAEDLDVSAGIALRLLDERLVIRGQGVYRGFSRQVEVPVSEGLEGELLVEIQLSPSVSLEVFYRREGDVLSETLITSETGAGINYHTEFTTWRSLIRNILGRSSTETDPAAKTN